MISDQTVLQFATLFQGRMDAFGDIAPDGTVHGAQRLSEPLTWSEWVDRCRGHLDGSQSPLGVYPQRDDGTVVWGCVDFDEGEDESRTHALNVSNALHEFGVSGYVERSRSKGYHVWVFFEDWMDARTVRRALLAVCQLVGAPTKEINPKQYIPEAGGIGNYVRLPYPATRPTGRQVVVDEAGNEATPVQFLSWASTMSGRYGGLEILADYYQPPAPPTPPAPVNVTWSTELPHYIQTIVEGGPLEGEADRSEWLYRLCCHMRDRGVAYDLAYDTLRQADERWTRKFVVRRDGGQRDLTNMLRKAYG